MWSTGGPPFSVIRAMTSSSDHSEHQTESVAGLTKMWPYASSSVS